MVAPLEPTPLSEQDRPSRLIRVLLSLSTSPVSTDLTNSPALNAFVLRSMRAGWTIRQAYYRNWTIWRNTGENPHGLIVLPTERPRSGDLYAVFIAIELLRCTTGRWPVDLTLLPRLVTSVATASPGALIERYCQAERELTRWRLWR